MGAHDGHRERLRNRFLTFGLDALEDHEVLELLLFYAIQRRDTNPLAHELIRVFGSLAGVMDASVSELEKVEGIGKHAASLVFLCKPLARRYGLSQNDKKEPLNSVYKCAHYLTPYFFGAKEEHAYLLCLDAKSRPICCREISSGSAISTDLPIRRATQVALDCNAVSVILSHNHPNTPCSPSSDDIAATTTLRQTLSSTGVVLLDHIVFGSDGYTSMAQCGMLT